MATLTNDEVLSRAEKWARLHKNEKRRGMMDGVLEGLSTADQRRVYLCGMRISGGLTPKVIPAATKAQAEPPQAKPEALPKQKRGKPEALPKEAKHENKKKPVAKKRNGRSPFA